MFILGLVNILVKHANREGFGLTPLSGDSHGFMPPLLKKTRLFVCFVLKKLCSKAKWLRSLVQDFVQNLVRGFEWLEVLGFTWASKVCTCTPTENVGRKKEKQIKLSFYVSDIWKQYRMKEIPTYPSQHWQWTSKCIGHLNKIKLAFCYMWLFK